MTIGEAATIIDAELAHPDGCDLNEVRSVQQMVERLDFAAAQALRAAAEAETDDAAAR